MVYDHSLGRNDIFKFIYYSTIILIIYHYVGRNDILKFVYCFMTLFIIYIFKYFLLLVPCRNQWSAIMLSF
jgi:hypothetical protein